MLGEPSDDGGMGGGPHRRGCLLERRPFVADHADRLQLLLRSEHAGFLSLAFRPHIPPSEKSFSRGVKLLFEGFLASYRNPSFHGNRNIPKHEAVEQIILSSQPMFTLDSESIILIED